MKEDTWKLKDLQFLIKPSEGQSNFSSTQSVSENKDIL